MATRPEEITKIQCAECAHYSPALDPNVQKAYFGYCEKRHWPFNEMIPQSGFSWMKEQDCALFEASGQNG